jgi:repressor LexA
MAHTPPGKTREKVFRFVRKRLLAGAPPTVREVQEEMGFAAVESARKHLEALVNDGRLAKTPGRSRGYRLAGSPRSRRPAALVPVLGAVPAGDLQLAVQAPDGYLLVESRFSADELFALEVRGDSMVEAGIFSGDTVVVRRQATANTGDVVVAMVDDEATVKILRKRGRRVELHPANPDYQPIVPPPGDVRILGLVIELRRRIA